MRTPKGSIASKRATSNTQTGKKSYPQMTLKELTDLLVTKFEGQDWELVDNESSGAYFK